MRSYSSRVMVFPEAMVGSSVTTNVLPAEREVTRVWTCTLSNSVSRVFGIFSVNARSSSALGLSWIFFASTVTAAPYLFRDAVREPRGLRDWNCTRPGRSESSRRLAVGLDAEVQADLGPELGDLAFLHRGGGP